jgi:hypothetical protein
MTKLTVPARTGEIETIAVGRRRPVPTAWLRPWQHQIYLVLQNTLTLELFTFTTSSKTGRAPPAIFSGTITGQRRRTLTMSQLFAFGSAVSTIPMSGSGG